jgi:2,3-bisphosphoglycerate-independent phosphoglycerate mutase
VSETFPLVALIILDGWGIAPPGPGNAVELADTPVFDRLWAEYPHCTLRASGEAVGLPDGQMGNSEVGHLTIGSGRILDQDLQRVNRAIADGTLAQNPALLAMFARAQERGGNIHLLGLVSTGGVHSHLRHALALLAIAEQHGLGDRTFVHAFTDGRDVSPTSAVHDLTHLPAEKIATVVGRYYAMDRDSRWDRTDRALQAIVAGEGVHADDPIAAVQASYDAGVTDEFIEPIVLDGRPRLTKDDVALFFNFRPDRGRQLAQRLLEQGYDLTTMTRYRDDLDCPVLFGEQDVDQVMAEVLAAHGATQLHMAETEKYAHVTYFFNGGREEPFEGEKRVLVPSPRDVPSYDFKPEMSAPEVTRQFCAEIAAGDFAFAVLNFANPDMVGHTGSIPAVIAALETVDRCLGEVVEAVRAKGGVCLITADHGNAEQMLEPDGVSPYTAHTTNLVPLILTAPGYALKDGELRDLVPSALALLGFTKPVQMTGSALW